jgi:hypothetical protein
MPVAPAEFLQDTFFGLQRHFLGVLSEPSSVSIASDPVESLLFTSCGRLQREGGNCLLDFGVVDSPGREHQFIRMSNLGAETVAVVLDTYPPWLTARWTNGEGERVYLAPGDRSADLEIVVVHHLTDRELREGTIELAVTELSGNFRKERFGVRLTARQAHPCGEYDFAGKPEPHPHDFGVIDLDAGARKMPWYPFAFRNSGNVPLRVSFSDLPRWLALEVDGYERRGASSETFFERTAPFVARLRPIGIPSLAGSHRGGPTIVTNDARPEFRTMRLDLGVRIRMSKPFIRVDAVPAVIGDRSSRAEFVLENLGEFPTVVHTLPSTVAKAEGPVVVPGAKDGKPGKAPLKVEITPAALTRDQKAVSLTLQVTDGEPPEVSLVIPIHRGSPKASSTRGKDLLAAVCLAVIVLIVLVVILIQLNS